MSGLRYVPRHKRRQKADRLHGAFAGGFSAGYFNTVGSREGWQPRQDRVDENQDDDSNIDRKKSEHERQQVEDFMDEQDHSDWGGPRRVAQELTAGGRGEEERSLSFGTDRNNANQHLGFLDTAISSTTSAVVPPKNVGQRLLHELGWRGGTSNHVYVPLQKPPMLLMHTAQSDDDSARMNSTENREEHMFLSKRRLQKIQIQQKQRVPIPPPKLDLVGLGYEAHQNAPEFRAYMERRKKQQRAKAQASGPRNKNVYRLADILGGPYSVDDVDGRHAVNERLKDQADDSYYHEFETAEDFVGTKSVGGFALREDDDDAFDDETKALTKISDKVQIDQDEYDTVIHDDDNSSNEGEEGSNLASNTDVGRTTTKSSKENQALGNALAAWANYGAKSSVEQGQKGSSVGERSERLTFDGRPMLPGFVMPSGPASSASEHRFRGPDLPDNFTISMHVFGDNERPLVLQALARASQLELEDTRRQQLMDEALEAAKVMAMSSARDNRGTSHVEAKRSAPPVPSRSGTFEGLTKSFRDRFAPATNQSNSELKSSSQTITSAENTGSSVISKPRVTRTTMVFYPSPLLSKRFRVPPIKQSDKAATEGRDNRRREEKFFQDTVLKAASSVSNLNHHQSAESTSRASTSDKHEDTLGTEDRSEPERPSMDVYRSIFGTVREEDDYRMESDEQLEAQQQRKTLDIVEGKGDSQPETEKRSVESHTTSLERVISSNQQPDDRELAHSLSRRGASWSTDSESKEEQRKERKRKKKRKKEKRARRERHHGSGDERERSRSRSKRRREGSKGHRKRSPI